MPDASKKLPLTVEPPLIFAVSWSYTELLDKVPKGPATSVHKMRI